MWEGGQRERTTNRDGGSERKALRIGRRHFPVVVLGLYHGIGVSSSISHAGWGSHFLYPSTLGHPY